MTAKERLQELIEEGAVIQVPFGHQLAEFILAGALWQAKPRALKWAPIFPEHQGHAHFVLYDEAKLDNDGRDVLLMRGSGIAAGVVPLVEAGLDYGEAREALGNWQATVDEEWLAAWLAGA